MAGALDLLEKLRGDGHLVEVSVPRRPGGHRLVLSARATGRDVQVVQVDGVDDDAFRAGVSELARRCGLDSEDRAAIRGERSSQPDPTSGGDPLESHPTPTNEF
jgi:hypothetical protein